MNETQKGAWFGLIASILLLGFGINMAIELLSSGSHLCTIFRIWSLPIFTLMIVFIVFAFKTILQKFKAKRKSISKIEHDERDQLIEKRAMLVAFVFLMIALGLASVIPQFIVGQSGAFPAWLLPIINFGVLIVACIAFSVAILVQYGRKEKHHE
jgi:hypothetical protein